MIVKTTRISCFDKEKNPIIRYKTEVFVETIVNGELTEEKIYLNWSDSIYFDKFASGQSNYFQCKVKRSQQEELKLLNYRKQKDSLYKLGVSS